MPGHWMRNSAVMAIAISLVSTASAFWVSSIAGRRDHELGQQGRHEKGQHARRSGPSAHGSALRPAAGHTAPRHAAAEPAPSVGTAQGEATAAE